MAENPKLTVLFEKMRGKTFVLDQPTMSAGRKEAMDICIKDASLSGHHCDFIRTESGSYIIRDNDSTNGTRINNVPITEQELKNSDIIQLGGVEVLYDCSGESGDAAATSGGLGGRTHTINLDSLESNLSTVKEMDNFNPFKEVEVKQQKRTHLIIIGSLSLLALGVVGLVVWLVMNLAD